MFVTDIQLNDEAGNSQSLKVTRWSSTCAQAARLCPELLKSSSFSGKKLLSRFEDSDHVLKAADESCDDSFYVVVLIFDIMKSKELLFISSVFLHFSFFLECLNLSLKILT